MTLAVLLVAATAVVGAVARAEPSLLLADPPTVVSVTPDAGPIGGQSVVIAGTNLAAATRVLFGEVAVTEFTANDDDSITVVAPPQDAGTVAVEVETDGGTSDDGVEFTYVDAPTVTGVTPSSGYATGGRSVVITGTNLAHVTKVLFGVTETTAFTFDAVAGTLTVTVPAHVAGEVDVQVRNAAGTSADEFTYTYNEPPPAPTVASLLPVGGPVAGGDEVVLTGTNLAEADAVLVGGAAVTDIVVDADAGTVTFETPVHVAGQVPVEVRTPGGTSANAVKYTYFEIPSVDSVAPAVGASAGGEEVVIAGGDLAGATKVVFGAVEVTDITFNDDDTITVETPAQGAGAVTVTVETPGGASVDAVQYTYIAQPTVDSLAPTSGTTDGGDSVVITGADLTGATKVFFGAVEATGFTYNIDGTITATTPAQGPGPVPVEVRTTGGTSTSGIEFTYVQPPPTVTTVTPAAGSSAGGQEVVIAGTYLAGATIVYFGALQVTDITFNDDGTLTVTAPQQAAGPVVVEVRTPSGVSENGIEYTYVDPPTVTSLAPTSGSTEGGQSVVITGTDLATVTKVLFGAVEAPGFTYDADAGTITVAAPAQEAGSVAVEVETAAGTSSNGVQFLYVLPLPTVASVTPDDGSSAGGQSVVIAGAHLADATRVLFGEVAVTEFTANDDDSITVVAPPQAAGTVAVEVETAGGTSTDGVEFTYIDAPTVTGVTPSSGFTTGGQSVVIEGTSLATVTKVFFGALEAPGFTFDADAGTLTVNAPAHLAGEVEVQVRNPAGTSADEFTYTYNEPPPAPTVTSLTPSGGPVAGEQPVVITGTNLADAEAVVFGGADITELTFNDEDDTITFTVPAHATGQVTVEVRTPGGTSASGVKYTYFAAPTVASVTPATGASAGGASVVIAGTNLADVTKVFFGAVEAPGFTFDADDDTITVDAPAQDAGAVAVEVESPGGRSADAVQFTYVARPTVDSLAPTSGSTDGGDQVVITGADLAGATKVFFGGVEATGVTYDADDLTLTATAPAHAAGAVAVEVRTVGGTSVNGVQFEYVQPPPTVTSVTPDSGSSGGGQSVVIAGTYLAGATKVYFGALEVEADDLTFNDDGTITVVAPAQDAATVLVEVRTPSGVSGNGVEFTYIDPPTVTSLAPTSGSTEGGQSVVITGTDLATVTKVLFGTTETGDFTFDADAGTITVAAPAHAAEEVAVEVRNPVGTSGDGRTYTYLELPPTVVSLLPSSGTTDGGDSVEITGTYLAGATKVFFGDDEATSVTFDADTGKVTALSPPHAAGEVSVEVQTSAGTSTDAVKFTYNLALPSVTSVTPPAGSVDGGQSVVIAGTSLADAIKVYFAGVEVTPFTVNDDGTITVAAPAHAAGEVAVEVQTSAGTSTDGKKFTYYDAPTVTSLDQESGSTAGGLSVVISGTNLAGVSKVFFGDAEATSVSYNAGTGKVTATSPAHAVGEVSVEVESPGGTSTSGIKFTYNPAAPTVTALDPVSGSTAGGQSVVITGTNLSGVSKVFFGAAEATSVSYNAGTGKVTATSPAHAAGEVSVEVLSPGGTSTNAVKFTYYDLPTVTELTPPSGSMAGGLSVVISGTNLAGVSKVFFGAAEATSVTYNAGTGKVTATSPAHAAGEVSVEVESPGGTSNDAIKFTYNQAAPTVTSVSLSSGSTAGGTSVVIAGTNLAGVTKVFFGSDEATSVTFNAGTGNISATSPAHAAGEVSVEVLSPGGTSANAVKFTYYDAPTVTALTVVSGTTAGGQTVVISGTNLAGVSKVFFGSDEATSVTYNAGTGKVTATSPAHAAGEVSVEVLSPGGTSANAVKFMYYAAPTVTALTPPTGVTAGGQAVVISGTNLAGVSKVYFAGVEVTPFTFNAGNGTISLTTPAHTAGQVAVEVQTPGGTSTNAVTFTYHDGPTVTSLTPPVGVTAGGQAVVISGTNLTGVSKVFFGSDEATSVTYNAGTGKVTATSPAHAAGEVSVEVLSPGGTSTSAVKFTYYAAPTVTSLASPSGSTAGGQAVVISGTNLAGVSKVYFAGVEVTPFTFNAGNGTISVTAPAHAAGQVAVEVQTPGGTSTNAVKFTYYDAPTVTSLTPPVGAAAGGQAVVISGTNLAGVSKVYFAGVEVTPFTFNAGNGTISVTAPAHAAGQVAVEVQTPGGTSTNAVKFTYYDAPTVTTLAPSSGSTVGGQSVVITGTNFAGATAVLFAGNAVTPFTFNEDNGTITVAAPAHAAGQVAVEVQTPGGTSTNAVKYTYTAPTAGVAAAVTNPPASQTVIAGTPVSFSASASGDPIPTVRWQVLAAGSNWTDIAGAASGTLTLNPAVTDSGKQYRAVFSNSAGADAVSAPATLTVNAADGPPDAPSGVTLASGVASVTASWSTPATHGAAITGYTVTASPGPATCTTSGNTCVLGATGATSYTVTVVAQSAKGDSVPSGPSNAAAAITPTPPPPTPPAPVAGDELVSDNGPISAAEPGQQIVLSGSGYAPFSTVVVRIYSEPLELGTVVTDATGSWSKSVTIPTGLVAATHTLVAAGVDASGTVRTQGVEVFVAVGATSKTGGPIVRNRDGLQQMFTRGADQNLHTTVQAGNGSWGPWTDLGGLIYSEPVAIQNPNGALQVFVVGGDHSIWYRLQNPDNSFAWWRPVSDHRYIHTVVVATNDNGRLVLFGRGADNNLYYAAQVSSTDPTVWTEWTSLSGLIFSEPTVYKLPDGRLEVFALGGDGQIWHRVQEVRNSNNWSYWTHVALSLGARVGT